MHVAWLRHTPGLLGLAVASALLLALATPCAAAPCRVEVAAVEGSAWEAAAAALWELALDPDECTSIRLERTADGAVLTYVTAEGRSAQRQLAEPSDLPSALEALRVRGPVDATPPPSAAATANTSPQPTAAAPARAERGPTGPSWLLGIHSGVRAGEQALLSPLLGASATRLLHGWELGMTASYELRYYDLQARDSERGGSSAVLGAAFGKREPLGGVAFSAGGRLALGIVTHGLTAADSGRFEGRLGAYLGLSIPWHAGLALRAELGADLIATDRTQSATAAAGAAADVPVTPSWALSTCLGLELAP